MASAASAPGKCKRPCVKASRRPATSLPRKTCRSTLTGRKKVGRAWIHRAPSGASPPAGTTQWTWGWCCSRWPHVWRTISPPMSPPRRFGWLATWQGFSGRLKQQVVHHALVDERETGERLRQREDDVDVADREQLLLASGHPRSALRSDTSGNADPAAVVEDRVRAPLTAIAMPAQRGRAALGRAEGRADAGWSATPGASRERSPCRRTMSATSKGGRVTAGATAATCRPCQVSRARSCREDWRPRAGAAATGADRRRCD